MTVPRGVGLNNPLNMEHSDIKWVGMADDQSDHVFIKFRTPEYGFRAACKDFKNICVNDGINTIRALVYRWAPPEDNNDTEGYINAVCARMGRLDSDVLDLTNWVDVKPLVEAMTTQEQGSFSLYFSEQQLRDGALLAGINGVPANEF
jgi:hypothetical protein